MLGRRWRLGGTTLTWLGCATWNSSRDCLRPNGRNVGSCGKRLQPCSAMPKRPGEYPRRDEGFRPWAMALESLMLPPGVAADFDAEPVENCLGFKVDPIAQKVVLGASPPGSVSMEER